MQYLLDKDHQFSHHEYFITCNGLSITVTMNSSNMFFNLFKAEMFCCADAVVKGIVKYNMSGV